MSNFHLPKYPSPAKYNWTFRLLGRRQDGYHEIQSILQYLSLCDTLQVHSKEQSSSIECILINESIDIPESENLVIKAARALQSHLSIRKGASFYLEKRIPIGSGLGGGSSNAATALIALNKLWEVHLTTEEMMTIAAELGSDIPFFLHGRSALVAGRGERIVKSVPLPDQNWCLIAFPGPPLSTKRVYQDFLPDRPRWSPKFNVDDLLRAGPYNDLEPHVLTRVPELIHLKGFLSQYTRTMLSGSGNALLSFCKDYDQACRLKALLLPLCPCCITQTQTISPLHRFLNEHQPETT